MSQASNHILPFHRRSTSIICTFPNLGDLLKKSSRRNQVSSNLNSGWLPTCTFSPVLRSKVVWYEISLFNASTLTRGIFCSHSMLASTLSNFSYVGTFLEVAQVNFHPDILTSLRSKPSTITLNKNGHRLSNLSLFFSLGFLMMLKSPLVNKGGETFLHAWTNLTKNFL